MVGPSGAVCLGIPNGEFASGPKDRSTPGAQNEKYKLMVLNKALPIILHHIMRSMRPVRFRSVLAVDLWPIKLDPVELEWALTMVSQSLREAMGKRRTIIIAARNIRFDGPEPATGLIGRYVVISLSDGGHFVPRDSTAPVFDPNSVELRIDQSLKQVYAFAKAAGGAASIKSTRTARNVVTTIVRIYLAQYSAKPEDRTVFGSKVSIAVG